MSDFANTVAAWTGAVGVVLTWLVKLVGFMLKRRTRVAVRLIDGPKLKVVNKGATDVDIQPLKWGGRWVILGTPEGVKSVQDSEGDYIRLDPRAELTFAFLPDQSPLGGAVIRPETASNILKSGNELLCIRRRDGKVLRKLACRDIKDRLRKNLEKAS